MSMQSFALLALLVHSLDPAFGRDCSQSHNRRFYETNHYTIRRIEVTSPFSSFFLVRHSLASIKNALSVHEGERFSAQEYDASVKIVETAIKDAPSFGREPPVTVVVVTARIVNCDDNPAAPTLDLVYHVFSTDPLQAIEVMPRDRKTADESTAPEMAKESVRPRFKMRPLVTYDRERRVFGQIDLAHTLSAPLFDDMSAAIGGSTSSHLIDIQLNRFTAPRKSALDRFEYNVRVFHSELPAPALQLTSSAVQGRFTAASKTFDTPSSTSLFRYGALVEFGHQEAGLGISGFPADTIANSSTAGIRTYVGMTNTTRYADTAISYGLQVGGTDLTALSFAKHIGDVSYGIRFPAGSHAQWDVSARMTAGHIAGAGPIPINDRFFGGNTVASFIPGDTWTIPNGPLVRSVATNLLNGAGFGGVSFYSTNMTIGKVLFGVPIIPAEVENAEGFGSGIEAAERTAENWFADDYEGASPEFRSVVNRFPALLQADLDSVQTTFRAMRAAGISIDLDEKLKEGERELRLSQNLVRNATDPAARGSDTATKLTAWLLPESRLSRLITAVTNIEPDAAPSVASRLSASRVSMTDHLSELKAAIEVIHRGPARAAAERRAAQDMRRPREIIDTLRHEANAFGLGVVGLFDVGRLWPDVDGARYGLGGGARFQVVNVNFTVGYAVNLGLRANVDQSRGEWLLTITYTNLFR
jgi:hypothetical protein